jgi:hypothetical protein
MQVVYGNNDTTAGQLKEQKKSWSNYALKVLFFAITMFSASVYQNQSTTATFTLGYRLFLVAIFVSVIMDAALIILLPSWGNVLVFVSWLLLEAASCLVILSFNEHYALAILALLFLILVALLQPKLKHALKRYDLPSFTNGDTQDDIDDEENQYLGYVFDLAQGIVNCGGMVTAIFGHYMVGAVTAVGFFFFGVIALGLYLMMVITVRAVARPHVTCLAIVLMVLLVITLITVSIPFARHSG